MNYLELVRSGFETLTIDAEKKTAALKNLERWLTEEPFSEYRSGIEQLISDEKWDLLLFNFFQTLPFGTGGRRGPVGIGPNTYNAFTLCSSVQGHVNYLRQKFPSKELSVVIAFDVRRFEDLRKRYGTPESSPLYGLSSRDFARMAAEVYAGNGVTVHMPDPTASWILSTPELSYAIRTKNADGGLNVSASHNHPDDNGGKFYDQFGGQEVPPNDEVFSTFVEAVEHIENLDFEAAQTNNLVHFMDHSEIHSGYIGLNVNLSLHPEERSTQIVMTNLHGAGDTNAGDTLEAAGFHVTYVPEQREHDGQFPNVPFRIANPEVPESMGMAVSLAKKLGADIVFSTDPDADRIGAMAPGPDGEFVFFTGNELGALVTDQLFVTREKNGTLPAAPIFVTTEVTSRLPVAVAKHHGGRTVDNLLVGCKYIANVISSLETEGKFRGLEGTPEDYVLGLEESHGIMVTTAIRDKDAAGAALMIAERASQEKKRGKTLYNALLDVYRKVGVHVTRQVSIVIEGAVGMEKIAQMQRGFRNLQIGDTLGGRTITHRDDYWNTDNHGEYLSGTDQKARNFLSFQVEGGLRILARPSGTEPKMKLYAEAIGEPLGASASDAAIENDKVTLAKELQGITDSVAQEAYQMLGLSMPIYALRVSPLLGLTARNDFATKLTEEIPNALRTNGAFENWLDTRIEGYGKDARGLIREGIRAWIAGDTPLTQSEKDTLQTVFSL